MKKNWKKLKTFDLGYFMGKSDFEEDRTQNYLVFQPVARYIETVHAKNINYVLSWKSKRLSDKKIDSIKTTDYMLNPHFDVYNMDKVRIKFNGSFLNWFPPTLLPAGIVNVDIVYEITDNLNVSSYPTLENCLFRSVKLTRSADIDKYEYSGYGIGFEKKGSYSVGNEIGRNVIIFGVDMISW